MIFFFQYTRYLPYTNALQYSFPGDHPPLERFTSCYGCHRCKRCKRGVVQIPHLTSPIKEFILQGGGGAYVIQNSEKDYRFFFNFIYLFVFHLLIFYFIYLFFCENGPFKSVSCCRFPFRYSDKKKKKKKKKKKNQDRLRVCKDV